MSRNPKGWQIFQCTFWVSKQSLQGFVKIFPSFSKLVSQGGILKCRGVLIDNFYVKDLSYAIIEMQFHMVFDIFY